MSILYHLTKKDASDIIILWQKVTEDLVGALQMSTTSV